MEFDLASFYMQFPWKNLFRPPRKKTKGFPLILTRVHFTKNSHEKKELQGNPMLKFSQISNLKLNLIPIKKLFQ